MSNIIECRLRRIPLDRQGYDSFGSYYGVGQKVWIVDYEGPCAPRSHSSHVFRSSDLGCARAYVRGAVERHCYVNNLGQAPEAKFVR